MPRCSLTTLDGRQYDVVIIGGGINGASSAQHLAAAGYSVLLVDKGDFGSGSTSRSTRVLHCGLRYFETPRPVHDFARSPGKLAVALRMARASMEMRGEIVKDMPERVRPFTLLFPIYRDGPYKGWQADLAFRILGHFGPKDVPLDYERVNASSFDQVPFINEMGDRNRLHSVAKFTEYMFDWPERICIDAILDAERMGADVRNHTRATSLHQNPDGTWSVTLADELDPGVQATVQAPILLNMAGIWIDNVNACGDRNPRRLIFGTKGAHIVVRLPEAYRNFGVTTLNSMGEPHYVLPSQGGFHHIGPTETVYDGPLDDNRVTNKDQKFLIDETRRILPGLEVSQNDIIYTWAGVRPLGYDPSFPKGKRSADINDLSQDDMPGLYALTGGPIMTHRIAAREITNKIRSQLPPSRTSGKADFTARHFPENPNSPPLLPGDSSVKLSDLAHAATCEHATNLSEILIARTGLIYAHHLTRQDIQRAAAAVSVHLGWDSDETQRQIEMFQTRLADIYNIT